ncbi:6-phosphogluconolactonase [Synechococcus sp. PCC 7502]|uniref:6-phosphogluconolactonase n=1 Tax=Synechococcus sp. PCC 7502 TaxID=1173263 RepID=UPI00029FAE72|nr:6-phosphogluconolactonase [Synechococcus sp. PCC 7502]AFY72616.1 6-phosphogluconolactonase [Synechococcus sp. PCC 7502]
MVKNIHISRHVETLSDRSALTARALELVLNAYQESIAVNNKFTLVASGGSTPKLLYEKLAEQNLDWQKVHVFWGDERYVPVTDPQSNEGMTRKAWLDHVAIPPENIHPMPTDESDPAIAAQKYETHLQEFFNLNIGEYPNFDLILLGLGDDGHTASLFPHTKALTVSDRLITVGEKDQQPRLTFTAQLINQAKQILFLVPSAGKENALKAVMAESEDDQLYPARLITKTATWLIT